MPGEAIILTMKDSIKYIQDEAVRLSKNVRMKRKPFTNDDSRKLVDLVQSMGKVNRLMKELEREWEKDVSTFVLTYFTKARDE